MKVYVLWCINHKIKNEHLYGIYKYKETAEYFANYFQEKNNINEREYFVKEEELDFYKRKKLK